MDFTRGQRICLSMIVKNEGAVIRRCLESVRPWIQAWAISDTGSTDDTVAIVWDVLRETPGMVYHDPWVDFGTNRSKALEYAGSTGCDYTLSIDADEVLVVEDALALTTLTADAYRVEMRHDDGLSWPRVNLLRSALPWRYEGRMHEYAVCDRPISEHLIAGLHMWTDGKGARGVDPHKAERDLAIMLDCVAREPDNARYWFYLGQSYEVAKMPSEALDAYSRRVDMGGSIEERWYAEYRSAQLLLLQGLWNLARLHYLDAYSIDPRRCEPLYWLAQGLNQRGHDELAHVFMERVALLQKPIGAMFVEDQIWDAMRWVLYCTTANNTGDHEAASEIAQRLLTSGRCPDAHREMIEAMASGTPAPDDQLASVSS